VKRGLTAVVVVWGLVWLTDPGHAYTFTGQRWATGSNIVLHLQLGSSSGTLMDGSTGWNPVAEAALSMWNRYLDSVTLRVVRDSMQAPAPRNGVNNVFFAADVYGESFGDAVSYARWFYRTSDSTITEADVVFNSARTWNSYRGNLRSASDGWTLQDLRRVALHEFGHVIGLNHSDSNGQSVTAIMSSRLSNIDTLQTDDINGARTIYGQSLAHGDTLRSGGRLFPGESLVSGNRRYRLLYQDDGNLVLIDDVDRVALWASATLGTSPGRVLLREEGNLVLYDGGDVGQWSTGTVGHANARLVVQDDGNLVIYNGSGQSVWDRYQ
jgi:hypothetical protein